ncbi:hypothetical protein [Aquimarina aquimarini]|uniref:hypothetical protein n=1 Tax=Aquimarina aquimarini TaxID=1191734 RepID=UPI000D5607AB|nr:hypothetical protein [Aquimarina aquimarini]
MKKIFLILLVISVSCTSDDTTEDPILCTEEARPGLEIIIKDATSGAVLTEGIIVMATDGQYSETLENVKGTNLFIGAYERKGTYVISISKTGYISIVSDPVIVTEDICHVITKNLEFVLSKE